MRTQTDGFKKTKSKRVSHRNRLCMLLCFCLIVILGVTDVPSCWAKADSTGMVAWAAETQSVTASAQMYGAAKTKTPVEKYGRLSVKKGKLVGENGKVVQLKGVSSHGMSWYPQYMNKKAFKTMRDKWGVEVVRLAMYTAEYNGYCTGGKENQKKLRKQIYQAIDAAGELGMYVIVDWHILSDNNPKIYQKQAKSFFKTLSKRYAGAEHVLYEICNEPNGGTSWSQIKSYAKSVIKTIRANDKKAIIIVGTPTWSQDVDIVAKSPLKGYKNLMYSFHFYAQTHRDSYREKVKAAVKAKLPIFVTEYSVCDASGSGALNKTEAKKWMQLLDQYKISSCIWNLSNKAETSSLIKTGCTKTSGWQSSDLTETGKWFVKMMKGALPKDTAESEQTSDSSSQQNDTTTEASKDASNQNGGQSSQEQAKDTKVSTGTAKGCKVQVKQTNSWGEAPYFCQFSLSLKNTNASAVTDWKVKIIFENAIELDSGWCANYQVKGKTLTITGADFNNQIAGGSVVENIGFIVKGNQKPVIANIKYL